MADKMNYVTKERDRIIERLAFLDAIIESAKTDPKPDATYGCQKYDIDRLCRFDRRALDRRCDGCPRTTDKVELERMGLWVVGISHPLPVFHVGSGHAAMD